MKSAVCRLCLRRVCLRICANQSKLMPMRQHNVVEICSSGLGYFRFEICVTVISNYIEIETLICMSIYQ